VNKGSGGKGGGTTEKEVVSVRDKRGRVPFCPNHWLISSDHPIREVHFRVAKGVRKTLIQIGTGKESTACRRKEGENLDY